MEEGLIGRELGGYRIEQEIGRGGMGIVYLAEQVRLGRRVALKVIAPELARDEAFRDRFERESRLAAAIDHPHIVPVYEAGDLSGILYIAMRYVEGVDLRALVLDRGPLDAPRAVRLVAQVASALDAAHARGLVHRDVKAGNVLLAEAGEEDYAYLTDFGLTKDMASASALTHTGHWVGTVDYVAPEQLDARPVDARTDVYALGCLLYEALAGRPPFEGSEAAKMYGHVHGGRPSLRDVDRDLASRLDPVLARAMAIDPADRFPSAGDLGRAALAAQAGRAVTAMEKSVAVGPASSAARGSATVADAPMRAPRASEAPTARGPRSRRGLWAGLAVVALALAVGAGAWYFQAGDGDEPAVQAQGSAPAPGDAERRRADAVAERERRLRQRERALRRRERQAAAPTASPSTSSAVSFESFSSTDGGYATEVPSSWTYDEETTNDGSDTRYRSTWTGPDGTELLIDATPTTPPSPPSGAGSPGTVSQPAFGSAREYVFSGGPLQQCEVRCVEFLIDDDGGGYAVLAGGDDFATARAVARRATQELKPYDF